MFKLCSQSFRNSSFLFPLHNWTYLYKQTNLLKKQTLVAILVNLLNLIQTNLNAAYCKDLNSLH